MATVFHGYSHIFSSLTYIEPLFFSFICHTFPLRYSFFWVGEVSRSDYESLRDLLSHCIIFSYHCITLFYISLRHHPVTSSRSSSSFIILVLFSLHVLDVSSSRSALFIVGDFTIKISPFFLVLLSFLLVNL